MKILSIIYLVLPLAVMATSCTVKPQKIVPAEFVSGQTQFHRVCANCHGADAMGSNKAPGLIQGKYAKDSFSNGKIAKIILKGSASGAMPAQKYKLTEAEIKEVIKYLRYSQKDI